MANTVKDCCKSRITRVQLPPGDRPEIQVFQCLVCRCKHYVLSVDAGVIGAKFLPQQAGA